jgi:hypothetical protein
MADLLFDADLVLLSRVEAALEALLAIECALVVPSPGRDLLLDLVVKVLSELEHAVPEQGDGLAQLRRVGEGIRFEDLLESELHYSGVRIRSKIIGWG